MIDGEGFVETKRRTKLNVREMLMGPGLDIGEVAVDFGFSGCLINESN